MESIFSRAQTCFFLTIPRFLLVLVERPDKNKTCHLIKYIKNYISGALVPPASGEYLDNINPALGQVYSHIPDSGPNDVQKAYEAAERAFPAWSGMSTEKRFRILTRIADIIEQNLEDFARAESIDSGKPLSASMSVDIPRAHQNFRFFATAILHFSSESHHMAESAINFTLRPAHRSSGLYFTLESSPLSFQLENSTGPRYRQLRSSQAFRNHPNDGILAIQSLHGSRGSQKGY